VVLMVVVVEGGGELSSSGARVQTIVNSTGQVEDDLRSLGLIKRKRLKVQRRNGGAQFDRRERIEFSERRASVLFSFAQDILGIINVSFD
jgi:hypothetical protein